MEKTKGMDLIEDASVSVDQEKLEEDATSLRGTLFSTIVFVGGGIGANIVILFVYYMMRV